MPLVLNNASRRKKYVAYILQSVDGSRAPWSDGFNLNFFKRYWSILKGQIMETLNKFFDSKEWDLNLNHSFVTLVPKLIRPLNSSNSAYTNFTLNVHFLPGDRESIDFWSNKWIGNVALKEAFPRIFALATRKDGKVSETVSGGLGPVMDNTQLIHTVQWFKGPHMTPDSVWKQLQSVWPKMPHRSSFCAFPRCIIEMCWMTFFTIIWSIWISRNKMMFTGKNFRVPNTHKNDTKRVIWTPPPCGAVKFNVDAGVVGNNGTAAIGRILSSLVIFSKSAGLADPALVEVLVIKEDLTIYSACKWSGTHKLIEESDCAVAVCWFRSPWNAQSCVRSIIQLSSGILQGSK
ncbi:hypothetical protein J1N35_033285 [Gossypium stocksii]|uniref:RNase H type-1 domain-containing protein n=1 Tax=Gossypium stocksii TaxID=47602 RepID=A0A9D3UQD2_9ROSI|nr:hypothetical protein J1N35_033285 [Gossypium stocksii]